MNCDFAMFFKETSCQWFKPSLESLFCRKLLHMYNSNKTLAVNQLLEFLSMKIYVRLKTHSIQIECLKNLPFFSPETPAFYWPGSSSLVILYSQYISSNIIEPKLGQSLSTSWYHYVMPRQHVFIFG